MQKTIQAAGETMKLGNRGLVLLFVSTAFMSAGLIFLSEPFIGKLLLPPFGGSPAVWNTCMMFFQAALLVGYAYAHWLVTHLGSKRQLWLHGTLLLVPLFALPLALPGWADDPHNFPTLTILAILTITVGAPFFVLATSGPLLQRWFAGTTHPHARQPYFLYAASNLGSFMALLAYPFAVEPVLSLKQQSIVWSVGYGVFIALTMLCMVAARRYHQPVSQETIVADIAPRISWAQRGRWLFFAFLPSSLMLGVTAHITTDVASVPLLWVVPLALYLLTFVVAFGASDPARRVRKTAPFAAAGLFGALLMATLQLPLPGILVAIFYLALFTFIALVAHGRLAVERPNPVRLTEFYLWVAVGGVLGGIFNSLISPLIFNEIYEFPLVLLLTVPLLVRLWPLRKPSPKRLFLTLLPGLLFLGVLALTLLVPATLPAELLAFALVLAVSTMYLLYRHHPASYGLSMLALLTVPLLMLAVQPSLLTTRSFYGVIKVKEEAGRHVLQHGITHHGSQYQHGPAAYEPTTYYHRQGPLGDVFPACRQLSGCKSIGVVGLGAGTIAAYGRAGDHLTFYEIDPAIAKIAHDPRYFSYIGRSPATVKTVIGDGRLSLARTTTSHDLLIIDAFSSDAVPSHLLTREAIQIYQDRLSPHGLLAIHISNRHLNLKPVLKAAARDQHLAASVRSDKLKATTGDFLPSTWVVLAKSPTDLKGLPSSSGWQPVPGRDIKAWTDDYSNILDALR